MLLLFDGDLGARETLRFIEEKLGAGIWSWDLLSGNMQWSHGFFSLLGVEPDSIKPSSTILSQMVHPDDRPPSEAVSRTLNEGLPAEWEFRIIRPNGRIRWISARSELLLDSDGRPVRSIGVSFDVTKRHELLQSLDIATGRYDAMVRATRESYGSATAKELLPKYIGRMICLANDPQVGMSIGRISYIQMNMPRSKGYGARRPSLEPISSSNIEFVSATSHFDGRAQSLFKRSAVGMNRWN